MRFISTLIPIIFPLLPLAILSCADAPEGNTFPVKEEPAVVPVKPPSSFQDTLFVKQRSAIFYEPDSLQLGKIKALTSESVFQSSIHEFEYQFKNAKNLLHSHWKDVRIVEAKKFRYLHFFLSDGKTETIDLDKHGDAFGLFLFDPSKSPQLIEMTNAESFIPDYFEIE